MASAVAGQTLDVLMTVLLFILTAITELIGCYLPYLWLRKSGSPWLLVPAAISLCAFAWLLTLHPTASGRVYAAYGAVYVVMAILWLWIIDGVRPQRWDVVGAAVTLIGMAIIIFAPRSIDNDMTRGKALKATKAASSASQGSTTPNGRDG